MSPAISRPDNLDERNKRFVLPIFCTCLLFCRKYLALETWRLQLGLGYDMTSRQLPACAAGHTVSITIVRTDSAAAVAQYSPQPYLFRLRRMAECPNGSITTAHIDAQHGRFRPCTASFLRLQRLTRRSRSKTNPTAARQITLNLRVAGNNTVRIALSRSVGEIRTDVRVSGCK
jgi:hypothetical protein